MFSPVPRLHRAALLHLQRQCRTSCTFTARAPRLTRARGHIIPWATALALTPSTSRYSWKHCQSWHFVVAAARTSNAGLRVEMNPSVWTIISTGNATKLQRSLRIGASDVNRSALRALARWSVLYHGWACDTAIRVTGGLPAYVLFTRTCGSQFFRSAAKARVLMTASSNTLSCPP